MKEQMPDMVESTPSLAIKRAQLSEIADLRAALSQQQAVAVVGTQIGGAYIGLVSGQESQWQVIPDHKIIMPLKDMPVGTLLYEAILATSRGTNKETKS